MNNLYKCVDYEQLKEGEMILAFGNHVLGWDFDLMGTPSYGFVPAEEETCEWNIPANTIYDPFYKCSNCGYEIDVEKVDELPTGQTRYCPMCGKKIIYGDDRGNS